MILNKLSKITQKNFVRDKKVKLMAFKWPFWPLKGCFWNFLESVQSCQASAFDLVSLRGSICELISGSLITGRDYVVQYSHSFSQ